MRQGSLPRGPVLGEYELVRRLATGGMGEVFEARRLGVHGFVKRFAVKRILPQLARDERLVAMFCDEAKIHAALSHRNLVEVVDFGEQGGELFMVMEYVDGLTAAELLSAVAARRKTVDLAPALYVAREVVCGLECVHEASDELGRPLGLVHRDVAPSNILLGRSGEVKLSDFGIVRSWALQARTSPGEVKGKIGYVSPEQAVGTALDARSDLFSLGVVLAEMLIGRPLFPGQTEFEVLSSLHRTELGELRAHGRHLPADVTAILLRALSKNPGQRPSSARALGVELDAALRRHGPGFDADQLAGWLADLGVVALESHYRTKRGLSSIASAELREAPTLKPAQELERLDVSMPELAVIGASNVAESEVAHGYRLRRPGGALLGPVDLDQVLELIATGVVGLETAVSRRGGPFAPLGSFPELVRLAGRPAFRFSDFVGLRANERQAIVSGALPHYLFELVHARRTGLLCARSAGTQIRVFFVAGDPVFVSSNRSVDLLGRRLVASGRLSVERLHEALENGWRAGRRIGEALLATGALDSAGLLAALSAQRAARLSALCRMRAGELLFVDDERPGEEPIQPLGIGPSLVARAVLEGYSDEELFLLMTGAFKTRLRFLPDATARAAALGLPPQEAYALARAGQGERVEAVIRKLVLEGTADERAILRALFVGLSAGVLGPTS